MDNSIHFNVGELFPLEEYRQHCNGQEAGIPMITDNFLDVLIYLRPKGNDLEKFHENLVEYGVFEKYNIPFFVVQIKGLIMVDSWLNGLKIQPDEARNEWIATQSNIMNLYAVNTDTGILEGIRALGVAPQFAHRIKHYSKRQSESGLLIPELDLKAAEIQQQFSAHQIWTKCLKYKHAKVEDGTKGKRKL